MAMNFISNFCVSIKMSQYERTASSYSYFFEPWFGNRLLQKKSETKNSAYARWAIRNCLDSLFLFLTFLLHVGRCNDLAETVSSIP